MRLWRKRGQKNQALGRSCGGFTTKIHALCDALGNPLRFVLTGGERHDSTQALTLLDGMRGDYVLADKGYDADYIAKAVENIGAKTVIPSRSNSKNSRFYDVYLYKERNHIERLFGKLKQFRRIATRYDKTDSAFLGFIHLASILLWLK
jgi:transposase